MEKIIGYFKTFDRDTFGSGKRGTAIGFLGYSSPKEDCYEFILSDGTIIVQLCQWNDENRELIHLFPVLVSSQFSIDFRYK